MTKHKALGQRNFTPFYKRNQQFYRRLNDIYIDTTSIVAFLESASKLKNASWAQSIPSNIDVPSHSGTASVRRSPDQIRTIFRTAAQSGQWEKSLTFAISLTEDEISGYLKIILRSKPLMILNSIKNNEGKLSVNLADLLKQGAGSIIEEQIQTRVTNAMYASPRDYTRYLGALLQFEFPENILESYVEIKARRDLIVHASGVVNQIYLDKSATHAADVVVGDRLFVDRIYFENSMRAIKNLVKIIYDQVLILYGDDAEVAAVIRKFGL